MSRTCQTILLQLREANDWDRAIPHPSARDQGRSWSRANAPANHWRRAYLKICIKNIEWESHSSITWSVWQGEEDTPSGSQRSGPLEIMNAPAYHWRGRATRASPHNWPQHRHNRNQHLNLYYFLWNYILRFINKFKNPLFMLKKDFSKKNIIYFLNFSRFIQDFSYLDQELSITDFDIIKYLKNNV